MVHLQICTPPSTADLPVVPRDETDREVNVKARLPAWAKGKSVVLDMTQTNIKLFLKEEEGAPIIEVRYVYRVACTRTTTRLLRYIGATMNDVAREAPTYVAVF